MHKISRAALYKKAIYGALLATGYADQMLGTAITKYGGGKEVGYPNTGYYLTCITAWIGERVTTLSQLPRLLHKARAKIREDVKVA